MARPGAWWRGDFTLRFAIINGLPGLIVDASEGAVQTAAFEIEGDLIRALYVVRNPDKLRHLEATRHEGGRANDMGRDHEANKGDWRVYYDFNTAEREATLAIT